MTAPKEKAPVQVALDAYYAAYVRNFNPSPAAEAWLRDKSVPKANVKTPIINGQKDGALVKKLIAAWGLEKTLVVIQRYFVEWRAQNPRVLRTNADMGAIYNLANYLDVLPETVRDRRTGDNVNAAMRATRATR